MVFSSPIFLFLFLPVVLGMVVCVRRGKNLVLTLASIFFYTWGEGILVLIMATTITIDFICGLIIAEASWRSDDPIPLLDPNEPRSFKQKLGLVGSIITNLALLGFFKYFHFGVNALDSLLATVGLENLQWHPAFQVVLPLGISFFTFKSMSYTINVYRGDTRATRNLVNFVCFVTLFPELIAGPIVRYRVIAEQLISRQVTREGFALGVRRFVIGLGKKALIANQVALVADQIFAIPVANLTPGLAWLGIVSYTFHIYFDFSGYSDMAIGLGRMFGFTFPENFNYPYISRSIREFWRRWHITLSTWFRDYLYIALGGNRRGEWRSYRNLIIVFFLCGLWHGASYNFVVWGLFHGMFLVLERTRAQRVIEAMGRPLQHVYVMLVVMVGWVFFRAGNLSQALAFLRAMCGFAQGDPLVNNVARYLDPLTLMMLALAFVFSMPVIPWIQQWHGQFRERLIRRPILFLDFGTAVLEILCLAAIFLGSSTNLAAGTYNPFIYFRF